MSYIEKHVEQDTLQNLYAGRLSEKERQAALSHIAQCDYCAGKFAQLTETQGLMRAPVNLKERIMKEAEAMPVQLQVKKRELSRQMQVFLYGLKITAGVACSIWLLMVSSGSFHVGPATGTSQMGAQERVQQTQKIASEKINGYANQWVGSIKSWTGQLFPDNQVPDSKKVDNKTKH